VRDQTAEAWDPEGDRVESVGFQRTVETWVNVFLHAGWG
jgi:hypothetical protein